MALERRIKWLFSLIVLANLVIVMIVVLGALEPAPPKPMPNPNGYDDFVKAGTMLSGKASDFPTMKQDQLAALVASNAEALKLLRVGLTHECRVPDDYSRDYIDRRLPELMSEKALALNLCAEAKLAKMQNRTNDAAVNYLDAISLGERASQGGAMISKLIGIACEFLGREGLQSLTNNLSSQRCLKIAQTLETVDAKEFSINQILEQESLWMHKAASFREKIYALIHLNEERQQKARFAGKFQTNQLQRRQMMIDFAARAYQLEKGKPPAAIADLVPDYLKAVPKDPVTGSNLMLRANAP